VDKVSKIHSDEIVLSAIMWFIPKDSRYCAASKSWSKLRIFKSQSDLAKLEQNQIPLCVKTW